MFVQQGGSLTFGGTLDVSGNSAIGGPGQNSDTPTNPGLGAGAGLFLQGSGSITFDPGGAIQSVADVIADQTGVSGSGGSWTLVKNAPARLS